MFANYRGVIALITAPFKLPTCGSRTELGREAHGWACELQAAQGHGQTPMLLRVSGKLGFDLDTPFNKMIKETIICEADNLDLQGVVTHLALSFFFSFLKPFQMP